MDPKQHTAHALDETLSEQDFTRLSKFIFDLSGIKITNAKRTMLESRVRRRMQKTGHLKSEAYCRLLLDTKGPEAEDETIRFLDAITVNKTDFFREPWHFDFLKKHVFPKAIDNDQQQVKIWSAACSTGAEAYTIAMVAHDFYSQHTGYNFFILGTDISTEMVERAANGRFSGKEITPIPPDMRRRHLLMSKDRKRQEFRMAPHLRTHMVFGRINLTSDTIPVSHDYDVIFCRNVLIYFDKKTQNMVLEQLISHLRPGGYLILGHSESTVGMDLPLMSVSTTVFQLI